MQQETARTDLSTAVAKVIRVLADGRPYTLNRLAQEANLNFRTVKKAVELIEQTQKSLQSRRIEVSATADNHKVVQAREKSGLASLPENIQNMIIKATYPSISDEERILATLFKKGATSEKTAVEGIEKSSALDRLIEAEHVIITVLSGKKGSNNSSNRFYLSADAQMIAKGALSIYPELQNL